MLRDSGPEPRVRRAQPEHSVVRVQVLQPEAREHNQEPERQLRRGQVCGPARGITAGRCSPGSEESPGGLERTSGKLE
eukprot:8213772-Heterocapsa_arctica.AAC.1